MKRLHSSKAGSHMVLLLTAAAFFLFLLLRGQFLLASVVHTTDVLSHSLQQAEPYALNLLQSR